MKTHNKNDGLKIETEWNKLGYKVLDGTGTMLWTNRHCGQVATYYSEDEVELMTEEDVKEYKKKQRKINRDRRELYIARKEEEAFSLGVDRGIERGKKEQFIKDLRIFGYKIVMVNILDRDEILHYIVPHNVGVGYTGRFPYGREIVTGVITDEEINISELKKEDWFPDKMRMMIIE